MSPVLIEESPDQTDAWNLPAFASCGLQRMKYIRHRTLGFVLFEGSVRHDEMARRLGSREDVLSAGFVFSPTADFRCCGRSESLDIGAGPADAADLRSRMTAF